MNDDEPASPETSQVRDSRLILAEADFEDVEIDIATPSSNPEFSNIALTVARNKYGDVEDADDSQEISGSPSRHATTEDDMMLIREEVQSSGLQVSDQTILMAKTLLPDGEQVLQVLDQMDTTLKLEMLLNQFHSVLFWLSLQEFALLCLLLLFFMRAPGQMWFFLFQVPHLLRGFLGLQI